MSLRVYKSSAGSGKTTTLVNEYLRIALNNPNHFRHILAITFTNKAAFEMKARVISTLEDLTDDNIPISSKLNPLIKELGLEIHVLRKRAKILISLILHNYDDFAISTIDSFIHRIIRTFATDVDLPQNFEVVIDENDLIPEIIQLLYEKVGHDKELTNILVDFVLSETDEEHNYDPTSKLVEFIKHQLHEDGFKYINSLDNLSLKDLSNIIVKLRSKIASEKSHIIKISNKAISLCQSNNLAASDFFQGKTGILAYFEKVSKFTVPDDKLFPGKNVEKTINEDKWFPAKADESTKSSILRISGNLTDYYHQMVEKIKNYFFLRLVYSKIYSLALIHEIRTTFKEHTLQTGKVHISEFNKKISNEIAEQPVPFIYERLGRKYRHFLIDEFQDTSVLQWQNLLPLIDESLAYSRFNMLVGDAKQAIYRFRSGEVELFTKLPELYENDNSQISIERQNTLQREYDPQNLATNWRSSPEIIKFNNDFFSTITKTLSHRTHKIYDDIEQIIPESKKDGGLVSLNFIQSENSDDYLDKKHQKLLSIVESTFDKGYAKKDICILCRTKRNAIGIAEHLISNNLTVVSSESLLITNSPKVRLIISFLKLFQNGENEIALAEFTDNFIVVCNQELDFHHLFSDLRKKRQKGVNKILTFLGLEKEIIDLVALSTYEIAEFVLREIIKEQNADVFVQYLLDYIFDSNIPLEDFLARWDDKSAKLFISMPEDMDAIKIMTIHKAKGLDFPIVIVDAENIRNSNTKNEYWEDLNIEGLEELKVGLFPLSRKIELIDKSHIYEDEKTKTELDFLNLIYVANTRPVIALYTLGQVGTRDKFSEYLITYLVTKGLWNENKLEYNFGDLENKDIVTDHEPDNSINLSKFISTDWTELITVAHSESLTHDLLSGKSSRSYGNMIHGILSNIETVEDVGAAIEKLHDSAILNKNEILLIESIIHDIVTNENLDQYFKNNLIIKNESEVLLAGGEIIRPDRVVIDGNKVTIIDYKTGEEKAKDKEQIIGYRDAFIDLGYSNVDIKLIYLTDVIRVVDVN